MIELTQEQVQALGHIESLPPRVVNPVTQQTFFLIREKEYELLMQDEYDDGPWTDQEMAFLAVKAGEMLDSFRKDS